MAKPIFIIRYAPDVDNLELMKAIDRSGILEEYFVTNVPSRDDDWHFEVLNADKIEPATIEELIKKLEINEDAGKERMAK